MAVELLRLGCIGSLHYRKLGRRFHTFVPNWVIRVSNHTITVESDRLFLVRAYLPDLLGGVRPAREAVGRGHVTPATGGPTHQIAAGMGADGEVVEAAATAIEVVAGG